MLEGEIKAKQFLETKNKELEAAYKEAEKAKEEAEQATKTKSLFLSNMSHELRTPMNGVIGMTSLLETTSLTEDQADFVSTIRSSGETLLNLINDILDFSKIEANKLELEAIPFDLRKCIEDVLDLVMPTVIEKKLDLAYFMPESVPHMIIQDMNRVRQILLNLLSNATKFTSEGGVSVLVNLKALDNQQATFRISVEDTGIGIPEDRLDRLFQSFSQVDASTSRKYGGTGLGLAISKQLSLLMGGNMWVESEENVGSTFSFTIKAQIAEQDSQTPSHDRVKSPYFAWIYGFNVTEQTAITHHLSEMGLDSSVITEIPLDKFNPKAPYNIIIASVETQEKSNSIDNLLTLYPGTPVIRIATRNLFELFDENAHTDLYKPLKPFRLKTKVSELIQGEKQTQETVEREENLALAAAPQISTPHVLLATYNPIFQKIDVKILENLGASVETASNFEQLQNLIQNQSFDAILVELDLKGIPETEIIKEIIDHLPQDESPLLVALTDDIEKQENAVKKAGFQQYMSSPLKASEVAAVLQDLPSKKTEKSKSTGDKAVS